MATTPPSGPAGMKKQNAIQSYIVRTIISTILLVGVVLIITSNQFWRWMYPINYEPEIQQAASLAHVDPLLIVSVIHVESKFRREDVSHAGAIGLMQLMPDTATWIANRMQQTGAAGAASVQNPQPDQLAVPSVNILLGSWYLRHLTNQFDGNTVAAIAAYNAGPQRVSEWLENGVWNGKLTTIMDIPVGETRHFIDRVFYNYDLYKRIYGDDKGWKPSSR